MHNAVIMGPASRWMSGSIISIFKFEMVEAFTAQEEALGAMQKT